MNCAVQASNDSYLADKKTGLLQTCTDKNQEMELTLSAKEKITHDTYMFKFAFPDKKKEFGLHLGGHILFIKDLITKRDPDIPERIERKYTPTSLLRTKGEVEFPIKIYRSNVHPRFPDGGIMTQYLESLNVGDKIQIQGPRGRCEYKGNGHFEITPKGKGKKPQILKKTKIGMAAGGTGITPVFQIIQAALLNDDCL